MFQGSGESTVPWRVELRKAREAQCQNVLETKPFLVRPTPRKSVPFITPCCELSRNMTRQPEGRDKRTYRPYLPADFSRIILHVIRPDSLHQRPIYFALIRYRNAEPNHTICASVILKNYGNSSPLTNLERALRASRLSRHDLLVVPAMIFSSSTPTLLSA